MEILQPPHDIDIDNNDKLESMVKTLLEGNDLPPIVVYGNVALTGSHRITAYKIAEERADDLRQDGNIDDELYDRLAYNLEIPSVYISKEEYDALQGELAVRGIDYPENDDICRVLHDMTDRDDLKQALEDQF